MRSNLDPVPNVENDGVSISNRLANSSFKRYVGPSGVSPLEEGATFSDYNNWLFYNSGQTIETFNAWWRNFHLRMKEGLLPRSQALYMFAQIRGQYVLEVRFNRFLVDSFGCDIYHERLPTVRLKKALRKYWAKIIIFLRGWF